MFQAEWRMHSSPMNVEVDSVFVPGAKLLHEKEVIKNQLMALMGAALVDQVTAKKQHAEAVATAFRTRYPMESALARHQLMTTEHR